MPTGTADYWDRRPHPPTCAMNRSINHFVYGWQSSTTTTSSVYIGDWIWTAASGTTVLAWPSSMARAQLERNARSHLYPPHFKRGESAPDLSRVIYGVRYWDVVDDQLFSLFRPQVWRPNKEVVACCVYAAHPSCSCGIYAFKPKAFLGQHAPTRHIAGVVALSGAIRVHEHGYRAERARIVALLAGGDELPKLSKIYNVPIIETAELRNLDGHR